MLMVDEINKNEIKKVENDTLHHIFRYVFDAVDKKDFIKLETLLKNKNILDLKTNYLLAIVKLTFKYKDKIVNYNIFYNYVKNKTSKELPEKTYDLSLI